MVASVVEKTRLDVRVGADASAETLSLAWQGRYDTSASLAEAARQAGLKVRYSSYFNFFLFPLAVAARAVKRLSGSDVPDDRMPAEWLNGLLARIFGVERHLMGRVRLPIGLSLAVVLEKA